MEYPIDFMKTRCNPFGISTQHQSISINTNPCHTCHIYIYHTYNVVHPTTNLPFRDGFYNTHLYPFMLIFWMVFGWFPSANLNSNFSIAMLNYQRVPFDDWGSPYFTDERYMASQFFGQLWGLMCKSHGI